MPGEGERTRGSARRVLGRRGPVPRQAAGGRELPQWRAGMEWGEHHRCLFQGTEQFFRAGYNANLVSAWLPAPMASQEAQSGRPRRRRRMRARCDDNDGTDPRLAVRRHRQRRIDQDRPRACRGSGRRQRKFQVADATSYHGSGYDLIAFFDCLHDMANPSGAARHARQALDPDGHCMLVEPFAGDSLSDNLNPVGRVFYGASSLICVPVSLAQQGPALGAGKVNCGLQAKMMVNDGGFCRSERAAETRSTWFSSSA